MSILLFIFFCVTIAGNYYFPRIMVLLFTDVVHAGIIYNMIEHINTDLERNDVKS